MKNLTASKISFFRHWPFVTVLAFLVIGCGHDDSIPCTVDKLAKSDANPLVNYTTAPPVPGYAVPLNLRLQTDNGLETIHIDQITWSVIDVKTGEDASDVFRIDNTHVNSLFELPRLDIDNRHVFPLMTENHKYHDTKGYREYDAEFIVSICLQEECGQSALTLTRVRSENHCGQLVTSERIAVPNTISVIFQAE